MHRLRFNVLAAAMVAALLSMTAAGAASAGTHARHLRGAAQRELRLHQILRRQVRARGRRAHASTKGSAGAETDLADQFDEYGFERTAPAGTVSGAAMLSAGQQAAGLSARGGPWQEFTTQPYNAEPPDYTDPFWSNVGAGFSLVGGRTTALAETSDGTWYAGSADGGVWSSHDQGGHWTPLSDAQPTLSVGALAVDPADGSLWVGTGEANTNSDSYEGTGVYRYGGGSRFQLVGGASNPIVSRTVYALTFDPAGNAYAATDNGLFRYGAQSGQWTEVLDPAGADPPSPYDNKVTSVQVVPGSHGQDVIAAIGWRGNLPPDPATGGLAHNGFYASTDGGQTFQQITPTGQIDASDIGRTTFAYSSDGHKLYAIVESPAGYAADGDTNLQGIFVASGSPASVAGPWTKIADSASLDDSGSALKNMPGYHVGIQSWYNEDLAVDPHNDNHVYAGLEEVFESTDAGGHWVTASPYWNYGLPCASTAAGCPNTTHPDQHALMIADGKVVEGNDGGVYSRPLSDTQQYGDWSDLNATYRTWQYYDARAGFEPSASPHGQGGHGGGPHNGAISVWGGLQDNGTSVLDSGAPQMVEPAGGDGTDVIVDPADANRMLGAYADGVMYSTTDHGHTFYDPVSPGCVAQATVGLTPMANCDPSMRFVTPIVPDGQDVSTWVTGGRYVWVSHDGWNTSCTSQTSCSWQDVYDTGSGNATTALASSGSGHVIYAAFVGGGGNPGPTFSRGIATNYGGAWHTVDTSGLPNRFIAGLTVDPANAAHAYAVFNGFSRRWIPGGGVGHVFETYDGGRSWTDISGNLPDVGGDALVLQHHTLAVATDLGVYTADVGRGGRTRWSRLGWGLPNASVNDVTAGPDGYIYAATHGRGIWRLRLDGGRR